MQVTQALQPEEVQLHMGHVPALPLLQATHGAQGQQALPGARSLGFPGAGIGQQGPR